MRFRLVEVRTHWQGTGPKAGCVVSGRLGELFAEPFGCLDDVAYLERARRGLVALHSVDVRLVLPPPGSDRQHAVAGVHAEEP